MITYNDKLYLFGGTDGVHWFSDVWTYDPRTNAWTQLDCIGYIPVPREGHSATLVNDTMYIFGGRSQEGNDLGDLSAFRISSRRWYMFQNMGSSPSPRSGHSMTTFGKHVIILAGEPSSTTSERNELSLAYILDTSKIRYPPNESAPVQQPGAITQGNAPRNHPPSMQPGPPASREAPQPGKQQRGPESMPNGAGPGSRLPRISSAAPSGPPPLQQAPQPRMNGTRERSDSSGRGKTPTKADRGYGPSVDTRAASLDRENASPITRDSPSTIDAQIGAGRKGSDATGQQREREPKESMDTTRSGSVASRNTGRSHRQQHSLDSIEHGTPRRSLETQHRALAREEAQAADVPPSPSIRNNQHVEELMRELEAARNRNAWYASELALARKSGYNPNSSSSPILDQSAADVFGDDDRPLLEALLKMKGELEKVQTSIKEQAQDAAKRIAEVEKQRDAAVNEAIYAKAKLAAHGGGSQAGTPQPEAGRSTGTPEMDRANDIGHRLAVALSKNAELSTELEKLKHELEGERRAKQLAEETAEAAHKRMQELDSSRQQHAAELDSLKAELHEAERVAREASATASEAEASSQLLAVDKRELSAKLTKITEESKGHTVVLQSLRDALSKSSAHTTSLEAKLEEERTERETLQQKLASLRSEHEALTTELETTARKLRDAEELAETNAEEARIHRQAVLSGLDKLVDRGDDDHEAADERVVILQQQVEAANALVRKNQAAADAASEKLRRAEERIAGLEAYQEQSSREGLGIRKQLQQALRDVHSSAASNAELHQSYERLQLESNALEVQLKTLKTILEDRGVNPVDVRRSRILDSPGSRFGTPEFNRMKDLETQLEGQSKALEEMRREYEMREVEMSKESKEWAEKLRDLQNDHQVAVKYLKGSEKMLSKMKAEIERYKGEKARLEEELNEAREANQGASKEQQDAWETERERLRKEERELRETIEKLERELHSLSDNLAATRRDAEIAAQQAQNAQGSANRSRADADALRAQNEILEERAREAEQRVQMFLDQFESSVDNYRRQSQISQFTINDSEVGPSGPNGYASHAHSASTGTVRGSDGNNASHGGVDGMGHRHTSSQSTTSGMSLYSETDDDGSSTPNANRQSRALPRSQQNQHSLHASHGSLDSHGNRNSMALDNLASELDALRSHWETTNKAYRLSDASRIEPDEGREKGYGKEGQGKQVGVGESLAQWRRGLDFEDEERAGGRDSGERSRGKQERRDESELRTPTQAVSPTGPGGSAMI